MKISLKLWILVIGLLLGLARWSRQQSSIIHVSDYDPNDLESLLSAQANFSSITDCRDPGYYELVDLFARYLIKANDICNMMMVPAQHKRNSRDVLFLGHSWAKNNMSHNVSTDGSTKCQPIRPKAARTRVKDSYVPCPWHYLMTERSDRFPSRRVNAICNCPNGCVLPLMNSTHKEGNHRKTANQIGTCVPVRMPVPVLVRGKCVNGMYEWNFGIEEVDTSCVCDLTPADQMGRHPVF